MLIREAKELFVAELSRVEEKKMIITQNDQIGWIAIMQIKTGNMAVADAVTWYLDQYTIKNFRC